MLCDLVWFYRGGMCLEYLENLPLSKLLRIKKAAEKLEARLKKGDK